MRILVATDQWFPDFRGGVARLATETTERLATAGHELTVIAPASNELPRLDEAMRRRLFRVIPRNAFPRTLLEAPATWNAARRLTDQFDLIIGHNPSSSVGAAAAHPELPLVHVFHASPRREAQIARRRASWSRRVIAFPLEPVLARLERRALSSADSVVLFSEYSRRVVHEDHGAAGLQTRLLPIGIDTKVFAPADGREGARQRLGLPHSAALLVAVRRLDAGLGLEQLLHALQLLRDTSILLAIVGAGPLESQLRSQCAHLHDRVRFVGEARDTVLADWYRAADAFVLPPAPHEGFGLATVEALACGTPAVGAATGATPELLRPLDERLVAQSGEPASLARTIAMTLDLGASAAFRRTCRDYAVSRFSWDAALPAWERELEAAAARREARQDGASTLRCDDSPGPGARVRTPK